RNCCACTLAREELIVLLYSSMKPIYLDWAASSPMDPELASTMVELYTHSYGNPSSSHSFGRTAKKILRKTRERCSFLLQVNPDQLIFTSGGTEANTLPLLSLLRRSSGGEIVLSAFEHAAVYELGSLFREKGFQVKEVKPDTNGIIQPEEVRRQLSPATIAVAVMLVNNEIGSIQPIRRISQEMRKFETDHSTRIHFHCDAVQALGKIPVNLMSSGADTMAFSGHKLCAPKGIGLLYSKNKFTPLAFGGGQEFGIRPGTENIPAVWAFGEALEKRYSHMEAEYAHAIKLRDRLFLQIEEIEGAEVFPQDRPRADMLGSGKWSELNYSPYIVAINISPVPGEICARVLNDRGIAVATGSACSSSRKKQRGRVAYSITADEQIAQGIIRVSFGPGNSEPDIDSFAHTLQQELQLLRKTVRHSR
ncbi:MAG TPA: cysteine desulfurase family protein, partial [Clostridia bacterium]|nr:cysteine desulfurase family protein [Clostridia bacterium]